jgi:hypothetical protein
MSSKHNPWLRALCLAFVVSINLLLTGTPGRADEDDHSYLPPWMRNETAAAGDRDEKGARAQAQPPVAEAQLVKVTETPSSNFAAKVTQAKAKVANFVSNLFNKSISFAKGE